MRWLLPLAVILAGAVGDGLLCGALYVIAYGCGALLALGVSIALRRPA